MMRVVIYWAWALFWWLALSSGAWAEEVGNISTPRPYYDPKIFYDDYVYSDENGNIPEEDYAEDCKLPALGTITFKYWPSDYYDYRHSLSTLPVPQEEWNNYWPPRKEDGITFEIASGDYNSVEYSKIREEYYALQKKHGDKYKEELKKLKKDFEEAAGDENFVPPRPYPFCVDGKLGRHLIPDKFEWRAETPFRNIDPRLERFIPILRTAQPVSGIPVIADYKGRPPITHVEDGIEMGPYVERNGLPFGKFRNDAGCTEEKEFITKPGLDQNSLDKRDIQPLDMSTLNPQEFLTLEGKREGDTVLIRKRQTMSVPCKYSYGDNSVDWPEVFAYGGSVPDLDEDMNKKENDGITEKNRIIWKKRSYFQTAFTFNFPNCHIFSNLQFIVIAVKDFANMKYEVFRTSTFFFHRIYTGHNSPLSAHTHDMAHPYHRSWGKDALSCGATRFDDIMIRKTCRSTWQFTQQENPDDWRFNNNPWPIFPNWEYDNCIHASGEEEDIYRNEGDIRSSRTKRMSGLWPNHLCGKTSDDAKEKHTSCILHSKLGLCPPSGHFCHNSKYRAGYDTELGGSSNRISWGEIHSENFKFYNRDKIVVENTCVVLSCQNPNYTIPELVVEVHADDDNDDDVDDDDDDEGGVGAGSGSGSGGGSKGDSKGSSKRREEENRLEEEKRLGAGGGFGVGSGSGGKDRLGLRLNESFAKKFYTKGAVYVRRVKSVHTMTMYLAWMTLMGIGTLTARYYKETGGINPEGGNGCLGIGYWLWSHYFLFVFSLILMWIGIVTSHSIRRRKVPCNEFDVYKSNTTDLMIDCRYNNQVVRVHKVFGFFAAFLFHCALLVAWVRPTGTLRFLIMRINLRKLGVWTHVLAAYLGKMLCILSVLVFLLPRASSVCNDIPIWIILTEVLTMAFFAALCLIQWLEDKWDNKEDKTIMPVLEAVEVADKDNSSCYTTKVIVIILSVILHLVLFALMASSTAASYGKSSLVAAKSGDTSEGQGKAEILRGLLKSTCSVPSLASEEDIRMRHYYYTNKYKQ